MNRSPIRYMNTTAKLPVTKASGMPAIRNTSSDPNMRIDRPLMGSPERLLSKVNRNGSSW